MDKGLQEVFNVIGGLFSDTVPQILTGVIELLTFPLRLVGALLE